MGKRELLIAIVFIAVGIAVYELTAPPAPAGQGFSLSRLWQNASRGVRGNRASASYTQKGTLPIPAAFEEVRVTGVQRGVRVIGEDRRDLAYELTSESTGPDEATALATAKRMAIKPDDLGSVLAVRVAYPQDAQQWASLVLRVPSRLAIRVDGGIGVQAAGVRALRLENVMGDVVAESIAEGVTGSHRGGQLTVTGAGSVNLALNASQARFLRILHDVTLNARNGRCDLAEVHGAIVVDEAAQQVTIVAPAGTVRVSGSSGRVTIDRPRQDVRVDVRRAEVDVTLSEAVPLTLVTTENPLRLRLGASASVTVDAIATDGGHIQAADFGLAPESVDQEQRMSHAFHAPGAASAPRVVLRNARGDIVIKKTK
jgi:hypothetical protein